MKRDKKTNFIFKYLKFTGIFLYEIIYWRRLITALLEIDNSINNNMLDFKKIIKKNDDIIIGISQNEYNLIIKPLKK